MKKSFENNIVHKAVVFVVRLLFVVFATGILNAALGGFCNSVWVVCRNSSIFWWQKFVDLYIITAAKGELTDMPFHAALVVFYCLAIYPPFKLWALKRKADQFEKAIQEAGGSGKRSDAKRFKRLQKDFPSMRRFAKINLFIMVPTSAAMLYILTLQGFAYVSLKMFKNNLEKIRPVILEHEEFSLRCEWRMMETREDYCILKKKVEAQLERLKLQREKLERDKISSERNNGKSRVQL